VRVLLSKTSRLTARVHPSVLNPERIDIEVASRSRPVIGPFGRWCQHIVRMRGARTTQRATSRLWLTCCAADGVPPA
jgi:hypothetical protein